MTLAPRAMELGRLRRHVLRARPAAAEGGALLLRFRDGAVWPWCRVPRGRVREERDGAVGDRRLQVHVHGASAAPAVPPKAAWRGVTGGCSFPPRRVAAIPTMAPMRESRAHGAAGGRVQVHLVKNEHAGRDAVIAAGCVVGLVAAIGAVVPPPTGPPAPPPPLL